MGIGYNYLNLPNYFGFTNGNEIAITYLADGTKLTKVAGSTTKNYCAGIEYSGANTEAVYHSEGRCTPNGTSFHYEYTLKDHLGNARVNFRANGTAVTVLEALSYYPFGLLMEGMANTTNSPANDYSYNGKELNEDFGLSLHDYGARWYDAALGRWWGVDPLAEKYSGWSGYNYVMGNPLRFIDPDGRITALPNPEVSNSYLTTNTFSYDKKSTQGTDRVTTANIKITTQKNDAGVILYQMTETTTTSASVDANGKIGEVTTAKATTIVTNSSEGTHTTTEEVPSKKIDLSSADSQFQNDVNAVADFKKNNDGLSPVQDAANKNAEKATVAGYAGSVATWIGLGVTLATSLSPEPASKPVTIAGIGLAVGGAAADVMARSQGTDPEKIRLITKH